MFSFHLFFWGVVRYSTVWNGCIYIYMYIYTYIYICIYTHLFKNATCRAISWSVSPGYVWRDPFRCNNCSQNSWWTSSPPARQDGERPYGGKHQLDELECTKLNLSHLGILRDLSLICQVKAFCRCTLPICKQSMAGPCWSNPSWNMLKLYYIPVHSPTILELYSNY